VTRRSASCGDGSGLPTPRRRTLATNILFFARSDLPALRHPACAGQLTPAPGHGQPLTCSADAPRGGVTRRSASCGDGSGLPTPRRRTLATNILFFARSDLPALRHPACAGQLTPAPGHGQPLTCRANTGSRPGGPGSCQPTESAKGISAGCREFPCRLFFATRQALPRSRPGGPGSCQPTESAKGISAGCREFPCRLFFATRQALPRSRPGGPGSCQPTESAKGISAGCREFPCNQSSQSPSASRSGV